MNLPAENRVKFAMQITMMLEGLIRHGVDGIFCKNSMIVCQLFVFIKFYGCVLNGIFAYLLQDGRRATAEPMSEDVGPSKQVLVSPPSLLFVNCSMCEFVYTVFL
jgi:hypothetical protein